MAPTQEERELIVKTAREWVEARTPYIPQGKLKAIGCDCATFVLCVYRDLGLVPDLDLGNYSIQAHLHRNTVTTQYIDTVREYADEITEEEAQPGDLVLFRVAYAFAHSGIVVEGTTVAHAMNQHGVIYSDYKKEAFLLNRPRKFFRLK